MSDLMAMAEMSCVAVLCARLSGVCHWRWQGKKVWLQGDVYVIDEGIKLFGQLMAGEMYRRGDEGGFLARAATVILPTVIDVLPDDADVLNELTGITGFLHALADEDDTFGHGLAGMIAFFDKLEIRLGAELDKGGPE